MMVEEFLVTRVGMVIIGKDPQLISWLRNKELLVVVLLTVISKTFCPSML